MSQIVIELQKEALNPLTRVSDLLRKALVVARKLDLKEFEEWILQELNGYQGAAKDVPSYRLLNGNVRVWNPYHGWQPFRFSDAKFNETVSKAYLPQPIVEVETMAQEAKKESIVVTLEPRIEEIITKSMDIPLEPGLMLSKSQLYGVVETVRNVILEWSLRLEKQGILGEGMTFSEKEKNAASAVNFNIQNMYHSQIQADTQHSAQTMTIQNLDLEEVKEVIQKLKQNIDQFGLDHARRSELLADVHTIEPQLSSSNPKKSIISEGLLSIRNILEGAVGSMIATGLLTQINSMVPR